MEPEPLAHDERRPGQCRVDVATDELAADEQVRPRLVVEHRARGLERALHVLDHGQGRVLHHDALDRVLGQVPALGGDHRDGLTHVAHLVEGERGKARGLDGGRLGGRAHGLRRAGDVVARQHRHDSRQDQGGGGVDPHDAGVGVRRAQESGVEKPGRTVIVDVAPLPGQEPRILAPRHSRANEPRQAMSHARALRSPSAWRRASGRRREPR